MAIPIVSRGEEEIQVFFDNDAPLDLENNDFHKREFEQFSCDVLSTDDMIENPTEGRIPFMFVPELLDGVSAGDMFPTPDRLEPDLLLKRKMFHGKRVPMPNGDVLDIWGFEDPDGEEKEPFPSELIRVREGQLIHTENTNSQGTHTIHHHGIEPTGFNDGVGHLYFEVSSSGYTYQWQPKEAGTYIYHCHKNTVLHFQMGMYGMVIVDPPEGRGRLHAGGPEYDVETLWVVTELDTRWHEEIAGDFNAGLKCDFFQGQKDNPELNRYEPENFLITGVPADQSNPLITDSRVAITATKGQKILIRILCAGYTTQNFTLSLPVTVVGIDGRSLGRSPFQQYSRPFIRQAGETFELTAGRRNTVWIDTAHIDRGTYDVQIDFNQWISGETLGVARTTITIT